MSIKITSGGNTNNTDRFLEAMLKDQEFTGLDSLAQRGVEALRNSTPVESGATAASWYYEIERDKGGNVTIWWLNHNQVNGFRIAVGLQYGHATGTGGWVEGYDYINPALKPVFDQIANQVWKGVQSA